MAADEHVDEQVNGRMVRLAASAGLAQIVAWERERVRGLGVPDLKPTAEIGIAGELNDNDVAFAGRHLIVLPRTQAHAPRRRPDGADEAR